MAEKSRNFRSTYYDKVGFRGVEEKKALEILINEKPMDKEKMSKFCLRFTLPSMYREYVWKILLDVLPCVSECHESIINQRALHYEDLENSLKVMRKIDETTHKSTVHTLMYLMTLDVLEFDLEAQLSSSSVQSLIALASFFLKFSSSDVIAYWLFRNFTLHLKKQHSNFKNQTENVESILRKEDEVLHEHLKLTKAFDVLPLNAWFERCFAKVLHESSLVRVCDKVIGGSSKILPYVGIAMLIVHRNQLICMSNSEEIVELLVKNSEDTSDVIVNKALDMYSS
ncbi:TBC1 domain family member 7 [Parasteatoda tepidariorum]|uniref:TBC1 domain family member 7 n=1 Tax=Parasteatoda tepidariorum TaxID=114398 RepID=UPI001C71981D|nr:TBC1 domain family member 7 isoform X1 [Parasteatoda tepidariorum]